MFVDDFEISNGVLIRIYSSFDREAIVEWCVSKNFLGEQTSKKVFEFPSQYYFGEIQDLRKWVLKNDGYLKFFVCVYTIYKDDSKSLCWNRILTGSFSIPFENLVDKDLSEIYSPEKDLRNWGKNEKVPIKRESGKIEASGIKVRMFEESDIYTLESRSIGVPVDPDAKSPDYVVIDLGVVEMVSSSTGTATPFWEFLKRVHPDYERAGLYREISMDNFESVLDDTDQGSGDGIEKSNSKSLANKKRGQGSQGFPFTHKECVNIWEEPLRDLTQGGNGKKKYFPIDDRIEMTHWATLYNGHNLLGYGANYFCETKDQRFHPIFLGWCLLSGFCIHTGRKFFTTKRLSNVDDNTLDNLWCDAMQNDPSEIANAISIFLRASQFLPNTIPFMMDYFVKKNGKVVQYEYPSNPMEFFCADCEDEEKLLVSINNGLLYSPIEFPKDLLISQKVKDRLLNLQIKLRNRRDSLIDSLSPMLCKQETSLPYDKRSFEINPKLFKIIGVGNEEEKKSREKELRDVLIKDNLKLESFFGGGGEGKNDFSSKKGHSIEGGLEKHDILNLGFDRKLYNSNAASTLGGVGRSGKIKELDLKTQSKITGIRDNNYETEIHMSALVECNFQNGEGSAKNKFNPSSNTFFCYIDGISPTILVVPPPKPVLQKQMELVNQRVVKTYNLRGGVKSVTNESPINPEIDQQDWVRWFENSHHTIGTTMMTGINEKIFEVMDVRLADTASSKSSYLEEMNIYRKFGSDGRTYIPTHKKQMVYGMKVGDLNREYDLNFDVNNPGSDIEGRYGAGGENLEWKIGSQKEIDAKDWSKVNCWGMYPRILIGQKNTMVEVLGLSESDNPIPPRWAANQFLNFIEREIETNGNLSDSRIKDLIEKTKERMLKKINSGEIYGEFAWRLTLFRWKNLITERLPVIANAQGNQTRITNSFTETNGPSNFYCSPKLPSVLMLELWLF